MSHIKVSVIVPNYNHAPYLRQRLDSIFNQTFLDFEVIILDDCSTDNSKDIIEEYRNKPQVSHIIYNDTNSDSPFKQWAKGIDLAKGEYIWLAESDDWAELNFLEESVSILDNDKSLSLVFCNSFNEDGTDFIKKQNTFNCSKRITSHEALFQYMSMGCLVYNASSVLFRTDFAKKIDYRYQNFKSSGDYFFWICMLENGGVYYNYNCLNHYRIHNFNTSIKQQHTGQAFFEDLEIVKYLSKKQYLTFYKKQIIVPAYLKKIEKEIKRDPKNKSLLLAKKKWRRQILSVSTSKIIEKAGLFVWNILHKRQSF